MNKLKDNVLKTIENNGMLKGKDSVVLGFSGGPDSICLLNILKELALDYKKSKGKYGLDIKIYPVHVNHMLRGKDADDDEKACKKYCKKLNQETDGIVKELKTVKFDCNKLALEMGISSEEAGRKVRYESFISLAKKLEKKGKKPVIAVAHNLDDQAETILFRIIRGTGLEGLSGIPYVRTEDGIDIVRPILDIQRIDIEKYVSKNELPARYDHTNEEAVYSRNKIRLNVLPALKDLNPNVVKSIARLGESARLDQDCLNEIAIDNISKVLTAPPKEMEKEECISLNINALKTLHKAIRIRLYNIILGELGMDFNITKVALEQIDSLLLSKNHKKAIIELNGGYRVCKIKQKIIFYLLK